MNWLKKIILSEADEEEIEEPATMSDEQPKDSGEEDMGGEQTVEEPATMSDEQPEDSGEEDMGGEQTVEEPATMSDEDSDGSGEELTDDTEAEEPETMGEDSDNNGTEGDMEEGEESQEEEETNDKEEENTNNENLKKVKLLDEYKELYDIVNSIKLSFNNLEGKVDQRKTSLLDHAERIVDTLLNDILFTISNRFINLSYKDLLTNFYQFKFQLTSIMKIIEFLIQNEDDK